MRELACVDEIRIIEAMFRFDLYRDGDMVR
jgi:hypothetical protein